MFGLELERGQKTVRRIFCSLVWRGFLLVRKISTLHWRHQVLSLGPRQSQSKSDGLESVSFQMGASGMIDYHAFCSKTRGSKRGNATEVHGDQSLRFVSL
jgi:hypothetical protein